MPKGQFYVQYLGWKEINGLWGREFTEPITKDVISHRADEELPKLTLEVTTKEIKITQLIENKKGKVEKLKYPAIPGRDVTYAVQSTSPHDDVVSCIYLGYNPQTRSAVHVHVYRCDSKQTAATLVETLTKIVENPENEERVRKIERELVSKGLVFPRPSAYVGNGVGDDDTSVRIPESDDGLSDAMRVEMAFKHLDEQSQRTSVKPVQRSHTQPSDLEKADADIITMDPDQEKLYDSVAEELKQRMNFHRPASPILLPPKDYDTVHRDHGDLNDIVNRKSRNANIVGKWSGDIDELSSDSARGRSIPSAQKKANEPIRQELKHVLQNRQNNTDKMGEYLDNIRPSVQNTNQVRRGEASENIKVVTPRWKTSGQKYIPPNSPGPTRKQNQQSYHSQGDDHEPRTRAMSPPRTRTTGRAISPSRDFSPNRNNSNHRIAQRRARSPSPRDRRVADRTRSPVRNLSPSRGRSPRRELQRDHTSQRDRSPPRDLPRSRHRERHISPPPEFKRMSYFPKFNYPNYLSINRVYPPPEYAKKYSAQNLGLTGRNRDEGYRSLDRDPLYGLLPPSAYDPMYGRLPHDDPAYGRLPSVDDPTYGRLPSRDEPPYGRLPAQENPYGFLPQHENPYGLMPALDNSYGHLPADQQYGQFSSVADQYGHLPGSAPNVYPLPNQRGVRGYDMTNSTPVVFQGQQGQGFNQTRNHFRYY